MQPPSKLPQSEDYKTYYLLPDSIDTDEDTLTMEAQYEQLLLISEMERKNAYAQAAAKEMPKNGVELDSEGLMRSLSLSKSMGQKSPVEVARYWEKPAKPVGQKTRPQRIQQPR